jgi:hypothetical protein
MCIAMLSYSLWCGFVRTRCPLCDRHKRSHRFHDGEYLAAAPVERQLKGAPLRSILWSRVAALGRAPLDIMPEVLRSLTVRD